jgi:hypothetical protein
MPTVEFTSQLRRFTATPVVQSDAADLRTLLNEAFDVNPRLRGYILDDQSNVRLHVVVFIDGARVRDRQNLDVKLQPDSRVHVLQALSGG